MGRVGRSKYDSHSIIPINKRNLLMKWQLPLAWMLGCTLAVSATAQDWPQWRGADRDNISRETGWNPAKLDAANPILWKTNVGKGHSAVIVVGDRLFTQGMTITVTGKDTAYTEQVIALDAATGRVLWRRQNPVKEERLTRTFGGPSATPTWDDGKIYAQGREGLLLCLDARDGRIIWQKDLIKEGFSPLPSWGFNASPVVDGEHLFLNVGEAGLAVNKHDGRVIWKSAAKAGGDATPLLFQQEGKNNLLLNTNDRLCVLDPETGRVIGSTLGGSSTDPILDGQDILFTKDGTFRLAWNGNTFEEKWRTPQIKGHFLTGLLLDGAYYTMDSYRGRNYNLACLDAATGQVK